MSSIVRAIDVGHKNVKSVIKTGEAIVCRVFPACAPVASGRDLSDTLGRKRQTILVDVDGITYEVGPDASLNANVAPTHNMDDDYCLSDEYLALVRGALAFMKVVTVDLLVVGLPVTTFEMHKAALGKRLTGQHPFRDGKVVLIKEVKVLAQPHGALIDYALSDARMQALRRQRNLIIDCGARTFDWLVTQGLKIMEQRSHATNRGMYDVLQVLAAEIGRRRNIQFYDYERLDLALRTRTNPLVCGKEYDLAPHLPVAKKISQDAVTVLRRYVQDGSDIDNIILSGGAAFFFKEALRSAFPQHEIHDRRDGLYANVRGFALYGQTKLAQSEKVNPAGAEGVMPGGD
jgi:plasmid segregation protein ParM